MCLLDFLLLHQLIEGIKGDPLTKRDERKSNRTISGMALVNTFASCKADMNGKSLLQGLFQVNIKLLHPVPDGDTADVQ